jgi:hypothetical protein
LDDGTCVATKWFIFFFVPIMPLGSFRMTGWEGPTQTWNGSKWTFTANRVPLDWVMVARTYGMAATILLAIYGAFSLLDHLGW